MVAGDPARDEPTLVEPDRVPFHQAGTMLLGFPAEVAQPQQTAASYVQGVSLPNVLQMLHLERMTCLLEITADGQFGTLTLVNGELVDADANGQDGEEAVYAILGWRHPHTTILNGVTLFRHTVTTSLSALIVEAVRRQDEHERGATTALPPAAAPARVDSVRDRDTGDDWAWLVETLVMSGASAAAVVRADDEHVLAQASEHRFGTHDATHESVGDLAPVIRAAVCWHRCADVAVDELTIRLRGRHGLIVPLDRAHGTYVCAAFAQADAVEFGRATIRELTR